MKRASRVVGGALLSLLKCTEKRVLVILLTIAITFDRRVHTPTGVYIVYVHTSVRVKHEDHVVWRRAQPQSHHMVVKIEHAGVRIKRFVPNPYGVIVTGTGDCHSVIRHICHRIRVPTQCPYTCTGLYVPHAHGGIFAASD